MSGASGGTDMPHRNRNSIPDLLRAVSMKVSVKDALHHTCACNVNLVAVCELLLFVTNAVTLLTTNNFWRQPHHSFYQVKT